MKHNPIQVIRTLLAENDSYTAQQIEEYVDMVLYMPLFQGVNRENLIREVEEIYTIRQDEIKIISKADENRPWLASNKDDIDFNGGFWGRYKNYLIVKKNIPTNVVNQLDNITDQILDNLFNPKSEVIINKKGLVVGSVQSGKTSNYIGLINKAADAGFNFIVILAGIHNNLRSQTQIRIDEGFLGFDTQHHTNRNSENVFIGVGTQLSKQTAHSLTSSLDNGDFTPRNVRSLGINFNTSDPIIAVVKKQHRVLEQLTTWINTNAVIVDNKRIINSKSILLIDDEADNASIDTSIDPNQASRINSLITNLLNTFSKSAYVGYTATPFANIFIPQDDQNLFPRNFIINIPPPSNYIGPEKIFGSQKDDGTQSPPLSVVNIIDDYHSQIPDKHNNQTKLPTDLPKSLVDAIKNFIISVTIRNLRKQHGQHNSMLVHVSRTIAWQNHLQLLVSEKFNEIKTGLDQNDPQTFEEFRTIYLDSNEYKKSYKETCNEILNKYNSIDNYLPTWDELKVGLLETANKIQIRSINGGSKEALDYYNWKSGLNVIAIGGDKLSRGLTLEGLSVSYYLRSSKMYDTLMQMGRWFGYRPGYLDLCRLYLSSELQEWYSHIAKASEELRSEFEYMSNIAGSTPAQYALKVRTHPGVLQITAANKMRNTTEIQVSWSGRLEECYLYKIDKTSVENNFNLFKNLLSTINSTFEQTGSHIIFRNIEAKNILTFLNSFNSHENLKRSEPTKLAEYIYLQNSNNELIKWNIVIKNKSNAKTISDVQIGKQSINLGQFQRTNCSNNSSYQLLHNRLLGPDDEILDLTEDEIAKAKRISLKTKVNINRIAREQVRDPKSGTIIFYLLNQIESSINPISTDVKVPIVAYAIVFPTSTYFSPLNYRVNQSLLENFNSPTNEY